MKRLRGALRRLTRVGALAAASAAPASFANNIEVSNISLTGQNIAEDYVYVEFDVSWENSWRTSAGPSNWDAAWVFIKFRDTGFAWEHALLNYGDGTAALDGHLEAAGSTIAGVPGGYGVFVYRDADGNGDVSFQNLRLRWNYGANNVADNAIADIQVFAIEMVYVAEGAFSVGGGGLSSDAAGRFYSGFYSFISYVIGSENLINVGSTIGYLNYSNSTGDPGDRLGPIPAAFPKGFAPFYCMKYEITQGQWVDFFNTLNATQKANHDITGITGKNSDDEVARNGVAWPDGGNATTTLPDVPVNYFSWENFLAYLDWSALRPMTELEYEKACRGPNPSIANEYAWGTANIHTSAYTYTALGTENEGISDPGLQIGNALYQETDGTPSGPTRVGIFAASSPNHTREETGGTFYGIMEMSGNVYERAVTVGTPQGRLFDGGHGNGILNTNGASNVPNWPLANGDGGGFRGGSYVNEANFLRVSDRFDAANGFTGTNSRLGGRGVRAAP